MDVITTKMIGKYQPAETTTVQTKDGEKTIHTPEGYSGIIWGRLYDSHGTYIRMGDDYIDQLATKNGADNCDYWLEITDLIYAHCDTYLKPIRDKSEHKYYSYQCEFGGDGGSGMIDFWLPEQIPELPEMHFTIGGESFIMRWNY